jgi:uncharacterized glyoxalase superfamily protein PhnB
MESTFKPIGHNSVSPYFIVKGAQKWIQLLKELFQAKELSRYDRPDGTIMHAEVRVDDSVLMVSEATETYPQNEFMVHVYVPDAKAIYDRALLLDCEGLQEPIQKEDPDLRGMFKDFAGNVWAVATHL